MRLIHFSDAPVKLGDLVARGQDEEGGMKPKGLWLSDEAAECSWSWWCRSENFRLSLGDLLCVLPDRLAEAKRCAGELYGHARAEQVIVDLARDGASTRALVTALQADVVAFANGAEPHDDVTILALRWQGPPPGAAPAGAPG